ncbi:uncharacterized protein B0T15DRAFT_490019 [Chaetomium strumarium]|uniref:Protein kinase domain-containing protein n=1 Tax=Chaetomium strumarium TaxID=1170767 RepID=A0AAJ0M765_9PEZI|nr:hypothetical protein B0T15DRAFT_490019 [Chaetomium strumarium]
METPPEFRRCGLSASAVAAACDKAAEDRRRQTPDYEPFAAVQNAYKYLCEELHLQLASDDVDKLRSRITNPAYHECEARFLCDALGKAIFQNLARKHATGGAPTLDGWRKTSKERRRLLAKNGVGSERLAKLRYQIDDSEYWELEAKHLKQIWPLKEEEAWEKRRKALAKRERAKPKRLRCEGSRRSSRLREREALAGRTGVPSHKRRGQRVSSQCPASSLRLNILLHDPLLRVLTLGNKPWLLSVSTQQQPPPPNPPPLTDAEAAIDTESEPDTDYATDTESEPDKKSGDEEEADEAANLDASSDAPQNAAGLPGNLNTWSRPRPIRLRSGKGALKGDVIGPLLALRVGEDMYDPMAGWVLGSSRDDDCDLRLSKDNRFGVSRKHLRFDFELASKRPRITVSSRNRLRVIVHQTPGDRVVILQKGELLTIRTSNPITVDFSWHSFEAWYITSGKYFAAKEPRWRSTDSASTVLSRWEDYKTQYALLEKLRHPHIVKVLELLLDKKQPPWLIMEYVQDNLDTAVAYIHTRDFVHLDIKLSNILVQWDGNEPAVKLADVDTTRTTKTLPTMTTFVGTPVHMVPEIWRHEGPSGKPTDMWTVGLVALQLFTTWRSEQDTS